MKIQCTVFTCSQKLMCKMKKTKCNSECRNAIFYNTLKERFMVSEEHQQNCTFHLFTTPRYMVMTCINVNLLRQNACKLISSHFHKPFINLLLTFAIGRTTVLKAAKYSASPIGGARPPDHARFTLNPTPSPTPHCSNRKTKISVLHCLATLQQSLKM